MPLCPWCTDLPRPPHYLSRKAITLHKLAWEYRRGWREMDPNTSPESDTVVAIPEGPDADTQTHTTNTMDIDAGEDEDLPRVGKFMHLTIWW